MRFDGLDNVRTILMASGCRWLRRKDFFEFALELLEAFQTVSQISTRPPIIEPVIYLVREIRNELLVHHGRALAEVRDILARMTARLGDKIAKVSHQIDPDRFLAVNLRALDGLPDGRVEIFFVSPE